MPKVCSYCESSAHRDIGAGEGLHYVRCAGCGSIYRWSDEADYQAAHEVYWDETDGQAFLEKRLAQFSSEPQWKLYRELAGLFPQKNLLEVGAGTGHLLAAFQAHGYAATAVEPCAAFRRFMQDKWQINCFAGVEQLPPEATFDGIIMINTIEHIYHPLPFLAAVAAHLSPGGRLYLSTANAQCLLTHLIGIYWSMYHSDHWCFPSRPALQLAAEKCGLQVRRIWSTELPFETPVGLIVALRNRLRQARNQAPQVGQPEAGESLPAAGGTPPPADRHPGRKLLHQVQKVGRYVDLSSRFFGWLGVAGSIKALLVRPERQPGTRG